MRLLFFSLAICIMVMACGKKPIPGKNSALASSNGATTSAISLNKIQQVTLSKPYSCDGSYEESAVILTDSSKNSPDLLYNGACDADAYIEASTGGDDYSLISDLGEVDLDDVTSSKAFNYQEIAQEGNIFKTTSTLQRGHVYAILTSKSDRRSLILYKVLEHTQNGELKLEYVVKSYSLQAVTSESIGFSWVIKNKR